MKHLSTAIFFIGTLLLLVSGAKVPFSWSFIVAMFSGVLGLISSSEWMEDNVQGLQGVQDQKKRRV